MNTLVIATITTKSGSIIGPYFMGRSMDAIQARFSSRLKDQKLEIVEIGLERVQKLRGFKVAREKILTGGWSACVITE